MRAVHVEVTLWHHIHANIHREAPSAIKQHQAIPRTRVHDNHHSYGA